MKKYKIFLLTIIFIFNLYLKVFAVETFLNINLKGSMKKGAEIDLIVKIENIERLYAGDIRFNFDKEYMELCSFKTGDLINDKNINKLEFGGKIDKSQNNFSYQFTCTGKVKGFSGSGELAIIKARLLKDIDSSFIDSKKFNIQLCERSEKGNIDFINYKVKSNEGLKDKIIESAKNNKNEVKNKNIIDKTNKSFNLDKQKENKLLQDNKIKEDQINKVNKEKSNKQDNKQDKNTNYKTVNDNSKKNDDLKKNNNGMENKIISNKNNNSLDNNKKVESRDINKIVSIAIILISIIIILTIIYYKSKRK